MKWICGECGGVNAQTTAWINANTLKYEGEIDGDTWCEDCQEHTLLKLIEDEDKSQLKLEL